MLLINYVLAGILRFMDDIGLLSLTLLFRSEFSHQLQSRNSLMMEELHSLIDVFDDRLRTILVSFGKPPGRAFMDSRWVHSR